MKRRIGLVGLGIMGRGMAEHLLRSGCEVTVYNRTLSKARELEALGAKAVDRPALAGASAEVVITILADPQAVRNVVLGPDGVISGMEPGTTLIDCSTVDPETTSVLRAAADEKSISFLDSPVGGSKAAAASGELVMLVGGDEAALEQVRDVLETLSKQIVYAGPSGSGTLLKLCFNLVVSHMAAALGEALVLGVSGGLNPRTVIDALMAGVVGSRLYEWKGGCIIDRDFSTNFSTKLMHKDLELMMSSAYGLDVPLPVTAAVKELFAMAKGSGSGDEDFCSVVKILENLAGVEVGK